MMTAMSRSAIGVAESILAALWVPIIQPCWSGSMPVLVEGAAEPVPSADTQLRDPLRIGNRSSRVPFGDARGPRW
jgi:hypothetical protein